MQPDNFRMILIGRDNSSTEKKYWKLTNDQLGITLNLMTKSKSKIFAIIQTPSRPSITEVLGFMVLNESEEEPTTNDNEIVKNIMTEDMMLQKLMD